jgi:phosphotransferase system enzyme I (PtsI)
MANINIASEVEDALAMQAEGIGLYRTEFEFMVEGLFLDEDAQYERYARVVKAMDGRPVTFRLFDAGGDKPLPFLDIPEEENPALGWRGGRLLLGHGSLLSTQARALTRASGHGPVHVLYPMIIDVEQFIELRAAFQEAVQGLPQANVRHGVMFEVPSACLQAPALLDAADFGSVGTNDLIQYLFAVDRNNEKVAYDYSPDREVLWQLMGDMAAAAQDADKPLAVCGELAGDPRYVPTLMDIGISQVSVSTRLIPGARLAARKTG